MIDWLTPVLSIVITSVWLVVLTLLALAFRKRLGKHSKHALFWLMVIPTVFASVYLAADTVSHNIHSITKGPVHWHADYEVWVCGNKLDLVDPVFPRNKIGSPLLHEHKDDRIHIEGALREVEDARVSEYFRLIGGELTQTSIAYPVGNKGDAPSLVKYSNGDRCPSGSVGTLSVYVNGKRIENAASYVPYPSIYAPPGDCIIISFDESASPTTEKVCTSWAAAGWDYDTFERDAVTIGGVQWQ